MEPWIIVIAREVYGILQRKERPSYKLTRGRWLWNEATRLDERCKRFNIAEHERAAAEAIGAQSCSQMTKLAESGFKKVFKLVMDNNSVVIARIPNPNIGRADRVIASEVATMGFVRTDELRLM